MVSENLADDNPRPLDFTDCGRLSSGVGSGALSGVPQDYQGSSFQLEFDTMTKGAIQLVDHCEDQYISTLFLVPKPVGFRPVFNLKFLNVFVIKIHFKMEGLPTALGLIQHKDFMASLDLRDAYFAIPVAEEFRHYLRFIWQGEVFQFVCVPFGLTSAPRIFTKITKPILAYLRARGTRMTMYLDDTLIMASSREECVTQVHSTLRLFEDLGFVVNREKSVIRPVQTITYLGFVISSTDMQVSLGPKKYLKIITRVQDLMNLKCPSIRSVSKVIGLLVSTFPAVIPGPMHYRQLEREKARALHQVDNYNAPMTLSPFAKKELC